MRGPAGASAPGHESTDPHDLTAATPGTALERFACPPAQLLRIACREIALRYARHGVDLTSWTVVLPDLHAAPALARELCGALGCEVLLLPRIVTLRSWAAEVALDRDVVVASAQESALYRLLAERRWLAGADLWSAAAELAALFAELTRWRVDLPESEDAFVGLVDAAYRARAGASFGFEARLIHELWRASHAGSAIDGEAAYMLQLAELARRVGGPVHVLAVDRPAPAEEEFLERCARRVPVVVCAADRAAGADPIERTVAMAWPQPPRVDLAVRARELRAALPVPPLTERLRFFAAATSEQEAQAVDYSIRRWLARGCASIAVITLDRVSARRARALLERAEVLVRDEAGWALSTTSAATVIWRWLDVLAGDHAYGDCLDFLKSPFVFFDQPRRSRREAVWRLEQAIRRTSARRGIFRYMRLAEREGDRELVELLGRMASAERTMACARAKTIRAWLRALDASLATLGVRAGLAADAAGIEVLELLERLAVELDTDPLRLGFAEWRRWLGAKLESATFRDRSIESPVVFTTLEAAALRRFDALVLLGADAGRLPGSPSPSAFFNQAVRAELGLPLRAEHVRALEQRLGALIANCGEVLVTWQRAVDGEENLLSPLLERLRALHALAWGDRLDHDALAASCAVQRPARGPVAASGRPAPRIPAALLPASISASGYNTLVACPYRFFGRYALGLSAADEVREEIDKSDYGEQVHRVLGEFHQRHPQVSALGASEAARLLSELSMRAFDELIRQDYQAAAWLAHWLARIPEYIRRQCAREAEGWRYVAGEADRSVVLVTPGGRRLVLRGRIDRVDRAPDDRCEVIDYKTSARTRLRKALERAGEDVQLPVYASLWDGEVAAAQFLAIDRDGVGSVPLRGSVGELAAAVRDRLRELYDAIADGAPLPANGADEVCQYCEMQGLCRKKYWPG